MAPRNPFLLPVNGGPHFSYVQTRSHGPLVWAPDEESVYTLKTGAQDFFKEGRGAHTRGQQEILWNMARVGHHFQNPTSRLRSGKKWALNLI